ncbi:creatinase aminopeptidase [Ceraceosorus bombacis]|uniref:Creatinase aminopeptidase n=1 Tax=Ceraceosorus bombacis TaxID=401625 RepID=A0A0P1BDV3_9BASI|nr:creatinase aminopeptidase [Ceraceosorus bombacis]
MGAVATPRVDTSKRVQALRELMKQKGVSAYVIPSEDSHASEYPAESDLRRGYITGFTGSAGTAVVSEKEACLFTDGRYFLQAGQQLHEPTWTLMKQGETGVPTWQEYLSKNLPSGSQVGIDPALVSAEDCASIDGELAKFKSKIVALPENLVDTIWPAQERPNRPSEPIFSLDVRYAGATPAEKIKAVREELQRKGDWAKGFVASMLDEVAWLFNLRGSDVPYNPVFFAFALITRDAVNIYVNDAALEKPARQELEKVAAVRPYDAFYSDLAQVGKKLQAEEKIVIGKRASQAVQVALGGADRVKVDRSIIVDLKSVKNAVELDGFRACHVRDGAALASYFAWLEQAVTSGEKVSEARGADELENARRRLDMFRGLSFTTISSTGPNGAIIHYSPDPANCPDIDPSKLYLCDSGAQFTDGTTDVTRTWHFGKPSKEEVRAFTRVLQGHIAIDRATFPKGTTGYLLDPLARRPLWEDGLDFRHGVGHGVGHFLNVHEGPHGIGTRAVFNETALKEGMVVSNEPGYYQDGEWGIRIENLVLVRKAETPNNFGGKGFLQFEHLTLCPIQTSLLDPALLTQAERDWINAYHDETLQKVLPLLEKSGDDLAVKWLKKHCEARV